MAIARSIGDLWWFLADWRPHCVLQKNCRQCKTPFTLVGVGLVYFGAGNDHDVFCRTTIAFKPLASGWWRCGDCWERLVAMWRTYLLWRWQARTWRPAPERAVRQSR